MSESTCNTCPWWCLDDDDATVGECRVGRPTFGDADRWWPLLEGDMWCGEHPERQPQVAVRIGAHIHKEVLTESDVKRIVRGVLHTDARAAARGSCT